MNTPEEAPSAPEPRHVDPHAQDQQDLWDEAGERATLEGISDTPRVDWVYAEFQMGDADINAIIRVARKIERMMISHRAELKKYRDAEAKEARIQKELHAEHERIKAQSKEEVIEDLIKSGYSREELTEMAESTQKAIEWYMSEHPSKRSWLFAFKAGRKSLAP